MAKVHPTSESLREAAVGDTREVTIKDDDGKTGMVIAIDRRVQRVVPETQAAHAGVQVGWRVEALDGVTLQSVEGLGLGTAQDLNEFVNRKIKFAQSRNAGRCKVRFTPLGAGKLAPLPLAPKVAEQSKKFEALSTIAEDDRLANLDSIEGLNDHDKSQLLGHSNAVKSILNHRGVDELTVICGEKSSASIGKCHTLWAKLKSSSEISLEDVKGVDLSYTDAHGNNALHLMKTAEQAKVLLRRDKDKQLLECQNNDGENAVASVMKHTSGSSEGVPILKLFSDTAWKALNTARASGHVHPVSDAEKVFTAGVVPWPDVRKVLLSDTVPLFLCGMRGLSQSFEAARPGIVADDYASFWTEMLCDHCFGCLEAGPSKMQHTEVSKERLLDVFAAIELLLRACSDTKHTFEEDIEHGGTLKDITKGLLIATRGPACPPFDPREPYRKQFIALVRELQTCTASMLSDVYEAALNGEPDAVHEVAQFPVDELHSIDVSGALIRRAKSRLRMDSAVIADDQRLASLETPDWVLGQYLNDEALQGLRRSGVVENAADIVKISNQGGQLTIDGMTQERLRFCRLHAAWLRGYCNDRQAALAKQIRNALELKGDTASGPCKGVGGVTVYVFRTRSEAKGVPRILEKMAEAIEEELSSKQSSSILKSDTHSNDDEVALRELLTPACYVCDINGAEVVVDTFADLATLYKKMKSRSLTKDGYQIVRTKNGFSSQIPKAEVDAKGGYRDLKLFVKVMIGETPLTAELQLHIHGFHALKRVMHLPYECSRGSFDHPHLACLWQDSNNRARCCQGCNIA